MSAALTIRFLGAPDVRISGAPMPRPKTRKGLWLLALLVLRHDREVARDWLAGTLWPDAEDARALAYLRQTLTDLRNALGDEAARLLSPTPRTLRFDADGADVDVLAFDAASARADAESRRRAVALYRGPLLEGCPEEWVLAEREAREQAYLAAREALAADAAAAGDHAGAVHHLRQIVAADSLRESAHRALMTSLAADGDYAAVTQVYRDLRLLLREQVSAEPDAETQALFESLRADARRRATAPHVPPSRPDAAAPGGAAASEAGRLLPRPLTGFVGRERDVAEVRERLAAHRLVTLTGIGGVGKTRLALRVAEEAAGGESPDGAFFADLSPLSDPALVPQAVADALRVADQRGRPLAETLADYLRPRHALLVLDNCEHVLDAAADLAGALLRECPRLRLLATSRQRLGIDGEWEWRVAPLAVPEPEAVLAEKDDAPVLMEYPAVRLFVERAQRVRPDLRPDAATLRTVARVCRRIDGIPLAIELAAARTGALGLDQIAARLDDRFRLLVGGRRDAQPRQQTLRSLLDWSWDLLPGAERALLPRLSVFAGGWTLEAAEAVCAAAGGGGLEEWEVLDALTGLADRSLVTAEPVEGSGLRYRLLETVRQYARGKQQEEEEGGAGEMAALRGRHRDFFGALAAEAAPQLRGPDMNRWLDRLEREHDNLRAALDFCREAGDPESVRRGMRMAGDLQRFWMTRSYLGEGRRLCEALLARDDSPFPCPERALALQAAGNLAYRQADYPASVAWFEDALRHFEALGEREGTALVLGSLGGIFDIRGEYERAQALLERSLALHRETGDRYGESVATFGLGSIARNQGRLAAARGYYDRALALSRAAGNRSAQGVHLNALGMVAERQGDDATARAYFEQSRQVHRELGDRNQEVVNLNNLAHVARKMGAHAEARALYAEALALCRRLGESRSQRIVPYLLEGLAASSARRDRSGEAARLLGAAHALRGRLGMSRAPEDRAEYDALVGALTATLGEDALRGAWDEGAALPLDATLGFAQEEAAAPV